MVSSTDELVWFAIQCSMIQIYCEFCLMNIQLFLFFFIRNRLPHAVPQHSLKHWDKCTKYHVYSYLMKCNVFFLFMFESCENDFNYSRLLFIYIVVRLGRFESMFCPVWTCVCAVCVCPLKCMNVHLICALKHLWKKARWKYIILY